MKPFICLESTLDLNYYPITIRLWINEISLDSIKEKKEEVQKIREFIDEKGLQDKRAIINFIASNITNINAVQVMDSITTRGVKYGIVAYTVDFNDNVHG